MQGIVGRTNIQIQTGPDHTNPKFNPAEVPDEKAVKRKVGEMAVCPAGVPEAIRKCLYHSASFKE